jgi:hypothetical protein
MEGAKGRLCEEAKMGEGAMNYNQLPDLEVTIEVQ